MIYHYERRNLKKEIKVTGIIKHLFKITLTVYTRAMHKIVVKSYAARETKLFSQPTFYVQSSYRNVLHFLE